MVVYIIWLVVGGGAGYILAGDGRLWVIWVVIVCGIV